MNVEFEYEIDRDDYAAANVLLQKNTGGFRHRYLLLLAGIVFLLVPLLPAEPGVCSALFVPAGLWLIYRGGNLVFFSAFAKRFYPKSGAQGKRYTVKADATWIDVSGIDRQWRYQWQALETKGECNRVFIFFEANQIFIFPKRFLTDEQQQQLRRVGFGGSSGPATG